MDLDLINNLSNNLSKENDFVQNFIKELSNLLKNNGANNTENISEDNAWNNLISNDLELYNKKIISKYKDEMLIERSNILQNYAKNTRENGEMYYIYNTSTNDNNSYNLCVCSPNRSNSVITKKIEELPQGATLGSVLRKQKENFVLDIEGTKNVGKEINNMIKEKIKEQEKYLEGKRIEGHHYEVGEKYSGRICLYDLNNKINGSMEEIEEIAFPKDLYENAKKGDVFTYINGTYEKI